MEKNETRRTIGHERRTRLRAVFRNPALSLVIGGALAMNAAVWLFLHARLVPQTEAMPIHYTIYFGIDLLGPWWYVYILPAAGLLVVLVNAVLAVVLYKQERPVSFFLAVSGLLVQVIVSITSYLIVTQL